VPREQNQRILPNLEKSVNYAQENGWITDADLAGVAQAFCLAGLLDNIPDSEIKEITNLSRQLQVVLDKYGLSVFGRGERPEIVSEVTPLDKIRSGRVINPENLNHNNESPN
jgi:hypothetical protein